MRFKEAMDGCYRALDKLRNEKTIKAIGFGVNEADICVKFALAGDFDVAMMAGRYTLIDQTGLAEPAARARKEHGRDACWRVQFRHSGDRIRSGRKI